VDRYVIDKYDLKGNLIRSINVAKELTYVDDEADADNQFLTYRIRAIPNQNGVSNSISNSVSFIKESNIFFPTAFSPNGDKLNDTFFVSGQFLVKLDLSIFNRWGELVFVSTKSGEAWDGTYKGKPAEEGAYVWSAEVTDKAGRTFKESGTIALLRRKR
jgi:gliding motility-associated-like protein